MARMYLKKFKGGAIVGFCKLFSVARAVRAPLQRCRQIFKRTNTCTVPPFVYTVLAEPCKFLNGKQYSVCIRNKSCLVPCKRVALVKKSSVQKFVRTSANWVSVKCATYRRTSSLLANGTLFKSLYGRRFIHWIKFMKSSASESSRNACFNLERLCRSSRLAPLEISTLDQLWNCFDSDADLMYCAKCLTLGRTRKFIPPPWYKGSGGGGVDGTPARSFWYVVVF